MVPLYFIADARPNTHPDSLLRNMAEALEGGARLIQYRDKINTRRTMYENAKKMREMTLEHHALFLINDQVDLALAVGADGVHLGQSDLPLRVGRSLLGKSAVIGISTHTLSEAIQAEKDGADYIGLGPIFKTSTKTDAKAPVGIDAITTVKRAIHIPLYAIGGIQFSDLPKIFAAGADGIAAISAFDGDVRSHVQAWIMAIQIQQQKK